MLEKRFELGLTIEFTRNLQAAPVRSEARKDYSATQDSHCANYHTRYSSQSAPVAIG